MKLLHVDTSILGTNSVSREITAAIVARLVQAHPGITTIYHDLAATPPAHMSLANLPTAHPLVAATGQADNQERDASDTALEEFLAADIVVIGAPMYNFTLPSPLKSWIDRVLIPGKTFQYGANGVEGLARGKRVIVAISRGAFYGEESPFKAAEHLEALLRTTFGFMGVEAEIIIAEGVQMGPDQRTAALHGALTQVAELAAA